MQPEEGPATAPERTWYGWQIFLTDTAISGMVYASIEANNDTLTKTTILLYAGVAPLIHGLHGQGRKSALSLAMRASLPLIGGLIGDQVEPNCIDCSFPTTAVPALTGVLVGASVASLIDITLLSHERRPVRNRPEYGWAPTFGMSRSGFSAGIGGWF